MKLPLLRKRGVPRAKFGADDPLNSHILGVLRYHFAPLTDDDYIDRRVVPSALDGEDLGYALRANFWSSLFVNDGSSERLAKKMRRGRVIAFHGHRGSGKTTALHHFISQAPNTLIPSCRVCYFDVLALRYNKLAEERGGRRNDLCAVIADALEDRYAQLVEDQADWITYLCTASEHYRHRVRAHLTSSASAHDIPGLLSAPAGRVLLDEAAADLKRDLGEVRLTHILQWLATRDKSVLLVIDNIDQLSHRFQTAVGRHLASLAKVPSSALYAAIIAIRPENYDNIVRELDGVDSDFVPVPSGTSDDDASSTSRTARDIIRKRLDFLRDFPIAVFTAQTPGPLDDVRDPTLSDRTQAYTLFVHYLRLVEQTPDIFDVLLAWHSLSVRHTLANLSSLVEAILLNEDPVVSAPELRRLAAYVDLPERGRESPSGLRLRRIARSVTYRHMLLADIQAYGVRRTAPRPNSILFYSEAWSRMPYPELFVLRAIGSRLHDSCSYGSLRALGPELGLTDRELERAVLVLAAPRPNDERGFISIGPPGDLRTTANNDDPVRTMPSGTFLRSRLALSCEYVFWCALCDEADDSERGVLTADDFGDEALRLDVALRYLEAHVLPRLRKVTSSSRAPLAAAIASQVGVELSVSLENFATASGDLASSQVTAFISRARELSKVGQ